MIRKRSPNDEFWTAKSVRRLEIWGVNPYQAIHAANKSGIDWPFNERHCVCYDAGLPFRISIARLTRKIGPLNTPK